MAPQTPTDAPAPSARAKSARKPRAASAAKPKSRAAKTDGVVAKAEDKAASVAKAVSAKAAGLTSRASGVLATAKDAVPGRSRSTGAKNKTPTRTRRTGKGGSTAGMIGAAAAGLAAGLAANFGRKAVAQAPSALAGDWFEALKTEHRAALALFDALEATKDTATRSRSMLLVQLKHALTKHALTEENVVYPVLREAGEKGAADKFNHEHGLVKDYLYQLGTFPKGVPGFLAKLGEFRSELEAHIREEEQVVFPALHAKLGAQKNKKVTAAANKEGFMAA